MKIRTSVLSAVLAGKVDVMELRDEEVKATFMKVLEVAKKKDVDEAKMRDARIKRRRRLEQKLAEV